MGVSVFVIGLHDRQIIRLPKRRVPPYINRSRPPLLSRVYRLASGTPVRMSRTRELTTQRGGTVSSSPDLSPGVLPGRDAPRRGYGHRGIALIILLCAQLM